MTTPLALEIAANRMLYAKESASGRRLRRHAALAVGSAIYCSVVGVAFGASACQASRQEQTVTSPGHVLPGEKVMTAARSDEKRKYGVSVLQSEADIRGLSLEAGAEGFRMRYRKSS